MKYLAMFVTGGMIAVGFATKLDPQAAPVSNVVILIGAALLIFVLVAFKE